MPPRVSILLPARDAAATLPAALASVRRQTETDFECVVADDGSEDATAAIVDSLSSRDPRFRRLALPRAGLIPALQAGLDACRAPVVARMDADDLMHRRRLERQLAALDADPGLAAVGCHVRLFPRAGLRPGMVRYEEWLRSIDSEATLRRELFVECPIAHPTLCGRRDDLSALGYRDAGWPEDYDLVLRLVASGRRLGIVPSRLLAWRDGPSRLSRTDPRYALERFHDLKARFLADGFLAGSEFHLWGYGPTGKALRAALARLGRSPGRIFDLHRAGERIDGIPVHAGAELRELPRRPIVVTVSGREGRDESRRDLEAMGFREGADFVCAA